MKVEQSFVQKEVIDDDVAIYLRILWQSADWIPCSSLSRISFHHITLLLAIGGFRPGVMETLKFRHVQLDLTKMFEIEIDTLYFILSG